MELLIDCLKAFATGGVLCAILWPLLRKVKGFVLQKA